MGNLILTKDQLVKIYINNPPFEWLGFKPDKKGSGANNKYVI